MNQTTATKATIRDEIKRLDTEILRLAKEYIALPVTKGNFPEHQRILEEQCAAIREKKGLQKLLR